MILKFFFFLFHSNDQLIKKCVTNSQQRSFMSNTMNLKLTNETSLMPQFLVEKGHKYLFLIKIHNILGGKLGLDFFTNHYTIILFEFRNVWNEEKIYFQKIIFFCPSRSGRAGQPHVRVCICALDSKFL